MERASACVERECPFWDGGQQIVPMTEAISSRRIEAAPREPQQPGSASFEELEEAAPMRK